MGYIAPEIIALSERFRDLRVAASATRTAIEAELSSEEIRRLIEHTRRHFGACERAANRAPGGQIEGVLENLEFAKSMRDDLDVIRSCQNAVMNWLVRDCGTNEALLSTSDGVAILADRLTPPPWDYERDALIILGNAPDLVLELARRGQKVMLGYLQDVKRDEIVRELTQSIDQRITRYSTIFVAPDYRGTREGILESVGDVMDMANVCQATLDTFGEMWTMQGISNLPVAIQHPTINALRGAFEGKPVVIVGAGPSLDKNIDVLKKLQGKAVIYAVSHAVRGLLDHGIFPDLVGALDPEDLAYHFDGVDFEKVGAVVLGLTVAPSVWKMPFKRKFVLAANAGYDAWMFEPFGELPSIGTGGFVGGLGVALALLMGSNHIVLVGMDLSIPDGRVYSKHLADADARITMREDGTVRLSGYSDGYRSMATVNGNEECMIPRLVDVPGYYGGTVKTQEMYLIYRKWLVDTAKSYPIYKLDNCTEGGSYLEGFRHIPLTQVIDELGDISMDAATKLEERHRLVDRNAESFLSKLRSDLRECLDLSIESTKLCKTAAKDEADKDKLATNAKRVNELAHKLPPLSFCKQYKIRAAFSKLADAKNEEERIATDAEQYQAITETCELLEPLFAA